MMKKITDSMQKIACDILSEFEYCKTIEEVIEAFNKKKEQYELLEDPFTHSVCTYKQYVKYSEEYERQLMEQKFGYYEE